MIKSGQSEQSGEKMGEGGSKRGDRAEVKEGDIGREERWKEEEDEEEVVSGCVSPTAGQT